MRWFKQKVSYPFGKAYSFGCRKDQI